MAEALAGSRDGRAREQLRGRLGELEREIAGLRPGRPDQGTQIGYGKRAGDHVNEVTEQRDRSRAAAELEHLAEQVRRALERLEQGGYGICERCGREIAGPRLEALPWAVRCIDCAGLP